MYLCPGQFQWPHGHIEAIRSASSNKGGPGLSLKQLNADIVRLLVPYCPIGRQGDRKQNDDAKCVNFVHHFDGRGGAPILYRAHRQKEEVYGFHKIH